MNHKAGGEVHRERAVIVLCVAFGVLTRRCFCNCEALLPEAFAGSFQERFRDACAAMGLGDNEAGNLPQPGRIGIRLIGNRRQ